MNENVDLAIVTALEEVVKAMGQSKELEKKLLSWVEALHSGRESLSDRDYVKARIEVLLDETLEKK
jgi:hypothetical protein